jgi:acyl carrier protein
LSIADQRRPHFPMDVRLDDLRKLLVENCMLKVEPAEIAEDTPLFGPGGLGLDSIDAMQMTLAIEQFYKVPMKDPATAREALQSLGTLRDWLRRNT